MDPAPLFTDPGLPATAWAFLSHPANIVTALAAINFAAFAAFGIDKSQAEQGKWRISERALLRLALFGGTIGAYDGRALFRNKTRKQPFCDRLRAIVVVQIAGAAALAAYGRFGDALGL